MQQIVTRKIFNAYTINQTFDGTCAQISADCELYSCAFNKLRYCTKWSANWNDRTFSLAARGRKSGNKMSITRVQIGATNIKSNYSEINFDLGNDLRA